MHDKNDPDWLWDHDGDTGKIVKITDTNYGINYEIEVPGVKYNIYCNDNWVSHSPIVDCPEYMRNL